MSDPIPFNVTRYRCPHCPRTASSKARIQDHIARCWQNPEAKGCKTCRHFFAYGTEYGDDCAAGVDLSGRRACKACHGTGQTFDAGTLGVSECRDCGGAAAEIRPGPIVGCEKWEASRGAEA